MHAYDKGMLDVGDGNLVYWEVAGNPEGKPAVVVHGGPGSGAGPGWYRKFDLDAYQVVLFDQRGCGRSTPSVSDWAVSLDANTTHHLVADMELLREHLGIGKWMVFGGSWGATLGLAYAVRHPDRVSEVVLFGVGTTTRREVEWITREMGRVFPEEWARFRDGVPEQDRDGNLADAYARLMEHPDLAVREKAAAAWCEWEDRHVRLLPGLERDPSYDDRDFRVTFARLVTHYWRHAAWLGDDELLRGVAGLGHVPGVLVHGRLDVSTPLETAWRLSRAWPGCELIVLDGAGHGPGLGETLVAVVGRLAERNQPSRLG
ncbi:prolyl aminopeptidase [Nonomuraea helvata]